MPEQPMRTNRLTGAKIVLSLPTTVLLVVVTALLAGHAGAVRMAARPVSVGTVNLGRVLEELQERAEWDAELRAKDESITAEIRTRQSGLTTRKAELDALPDGSAADAMREALALDLVRLETWFTFKRSEMDRERALMWQSLFRSIRAEAERLAAAESIDLVLLSDAANELRTSSEGNVPAEAQVLQQITSRRLLVGAREVDLTDRLITRMNNARAARP